MKILKLRFQNINSLKGNHEIDFTVAPLANSGIFAIIGSTGSGKSTILDVITLALYNQTPRAGKLTKSTVEQLGAVITRNTNECFAEIEYEVQQQQYRSKWMIHRSKKGKLQDYDMELATLPDHVFLDLKKSAVPDENARLIGLNYDQFIKSILLSQGEFARFLKASPNERGQLLEKITGTEIYRLLGRKAFERQREEKHKLEALLVKLESIELLSDEQIKELEHELKNWKEE